MTEIHHKNYKFIKGVLLRVFTVSFIFVSLAIEVQAQDAQQLARPGFKNEEGVTNDVTPMDYPDLTACQQTLWDDTQYRGDRRILKHIRSGKDGWLYRSADFRTDFTMPEETFNYMVRVNEGLKAKGVSLYVVLQPSRAIVESEYIDPETMPEGYDPAVAKANYKALIKRLNDAGIHAPDLSDPPDDLVYFFKGDPHWRREGSQWTAKKVKEMVEKNPVYDTLAREEFSVEITWWLESEKGEFDEFVEAVCGVTIPPERRPMWATTSLSEDISEASLFGDVTYPDVAIVGTSNTAHEEDFNFVGSLKQELKADIRNRAVSAGAFSGSSLLFYSTDEFHEHPPKILIWEFLSHHNFDDYVGFRQMVPALEGPCTGDDVLATKEITIDVPQYVIDQDFERIKDDLIDLTQFTEEQASELRRAKKRNAALRESLMHEVLVFEDLEDKHIKAKDSYLMIEVKNPENRLVNIGMLFSTGNAEEVDVSRSRRAENNGRYFWEFDPKEEGELIMLQIETNKPQGTIKANICKRKDGI
tara:strand:- start:2179 stop:3768 length:1590 start_codon:yes stop_codon:yes gene_type:complete